MTKGDIVIVASIIGILWMVIDVIRIERRNIRLWGKGYRKRFRKEREDSLRINPDE